MNFSPLRTLVYFILDARCILCERSWLHPSLCPVCTLILDQSSSSLDWVFSSLILNENGRKLLHLIKYQSRDELIRLFLPYLPSQLPWSSPDLTLVPVPLSVQRFYQRGFNQSEYLAEQLSKKLKIRLETNGLIKTKDTPAQSTLDKEQRSHNLINAFEWNPKTLCPTVVCLVDDVFTTGETLKACRAALEKAGIKKVVAWTLFRKSDSFT